MNAAHFEALGMPPDDARSRAGLVARVARAFRGVYGAPPDWRWFVPGRIEVFGKHTDYAGGRSLLAAAPRGFGVAARAREDGLVRVTDIRHGAHTTIDPGDRVTTLTGWASYVQVVARRLASNFPGAELGVDLAIASDLPRAAGLSSSSALVVAVATALARRAGLAERDEWRRDIRDTAHLAWYLGCVENGLGYHGLAGTSGVGTYGGSQDHTAILACRAGRLSQYRFVPVAHQGDVPMPEDWVFVVGSSGVHADKAGAVMSRFNRASLAARALLALWNESAPAPAISLAAALAEPDACERLQACIDRAVDPIFSRDDLMRRLRHFVAEDARVPVATRAFGATDAAALGALSDDSQREADAWLGNQVPETLALAALARAHGALAASSFGAGFGGSVWAVVAADEAADFMARWREAYLSRFTGAETADWFVARPGPALTEVPVGPA